jgi:hypothetical protein
MAGQHRKVGRILMADRLLPTLVVVLAMLVAAQIGLASTRSAPAALPIGPNPSRVHRLAARAALVDDYEPTNALVQNQVQVEQNYR